MLRHRILLKSFALFFLVEILTTAIWPSVSYALTSGPTAPEASSFEPIDTTDLVNPNTGDLTYNMPFLEVPGPSGGYPLSLSYHAGIMTGEDASWVGLGWTLNPGAINRSVNGFTDDFSNIFETDRSFWEGGESKTWTIGVTVGNGGAAGVSAGLIFSDDTYKGFGVGQYMGVKVGQDFGPASVSASHTTGVSPYGGSFSSTGVSVGISGSVGMIVGSADIGLSFDQNGKASGNASVGISAGKKLANGNSMGTSLMDASMDTRGGGATSVGGFIKNVHNGKANKISTSGYDRNVTIPTPWNFSVRIGKSYTRYWIDAKETVGTHGALHFPAGEVSISSLDEKAYDVYDLQLDHYSDLQVPGETQEEQIPTPDMEAGGAFIDYDSYMVSGQGIMGAIRPYHFQANLLRQTNKDEDDETIVSSYPLAGTQKPHFRFVGDFSNQYLHDQTSDAFVYTGSASSFSDVSFVPNSNTTTGENGNDGYDPLNNRLPGSKHIEWFTNAQIAAHTLTDTLGAPVPYGPDAAINQGFIDCKAVGFTRTGDSKIGGFKIVNESGVTYHYALPVYSYDEHTYSGNQDHKNKDRFNTYKKLEPYAYTWLLTAVTGPDFVDRNSNGYADKGDWGYWVTFEYGKWSHAYSWRNPATDFNKDIDHAFNNFSKGKKELYYLNTVTTQTHTAVFVKELRLDGKGVVHELTDAVKTGLFHNVLAIDHGGFDPRQKTFGELEYTEYPVSTLKLKSVYLFKNSSLEEYDDVASELATRGSVYFHNRAIYAVDFGKYTYGDFVIDVHDVAAAPETALFQNEAIKRIDLNTDYSLAPGTENSFISPVDVINTGQSSSTTKQGKLTLKSIKVYGKGGVGNLIPETKFKYDDIVKFSANYYKDESDISLTLTIPDFSENMVEKGELLTFTYASNTYYGYVREVNVANGILTVKLISGSFAALPLSMAYATFSKTKNPPFQRTHYDLWGNYKSDYTELGNENISRMTTSVSAKSVDVWSLREIETSLGGKIKILYEPDQYRAALKKLSNVQIKNVEDYPGDAIKVTLFENASELGLTVGGLVGYQFMQRSKLKNYWSWDRFQCNGEPFTYAYNWTTYHDTDRTIRSINGNEIVIGSVGFSNVSPDPLVTCAWKSDNEDDDKDYHITECDIYNDNEINVEFVESVFIGGELLFDNTLFTPYGGDVRVKQVTVQTDYSSSRSTLYDYKNGITIYEPLGFAVPISRLSDNVNECTKSIEAKEIERYRSTRMSEIYQNFIELFKNARELPSPGVMYEKVFVSEQVTEDNIITSIPGKSEYVFEVFYPGSENAGLISAFQNQLSTGHNITASATNSELADYDITGQRRVVASARDYSAILGSLKRITLYDKDGNRVSETINHYLHDDFSAFGSKLTGINNQGVITETFADARIVRQDGEEDEYGFIGMTSQRIRYPSVQTGQTQINYKTGIKSTSANLTYDFYSGSVTKALSNDGYGNAYVTESIPAYRVYPVMGPASSGGYNMLTQEVRSSTYKVNPADPVGSGKLGLLSSSVQSWSSEIPVLDHPELTENFVFYSVNKRNSSTGLYPASTNGYTNYLKAGERVRFVKDGYTYVARVFSSEKNTTLNRYDYDLQLIEKPVEITGIDLNVPASRITVPRKLAAYSYIGDDNTALQADGSHVLLNNTVPMFDAWQRGALVPAGWKKNSEITFYDVQSHALEAMDMNGKFVATKMSADQTKVFSTIANAAYQEFAYTGAEEALVNNQFSGGIHSAGEIVTTKFHTGKASIKADPSETAFGVNLPISSKRKHMQMSVWVHQTNAASARLDYWFALAAGEPTPPQPFAVNLDLNKAKKAGEWYQFNVVIPVPQPTQITDYILSASISNSSGSQSLFVDDFRVHPLDAAMISYVYNDWDELSHILDNNNLYTEYRYDAMGRLTESIRETFIRSQDNTYGNQGIVKVSDVTYNYGSNTPYTTTVTTSVSGPSGTLSQVGAISVKQGDQLTIEIRETCPANMLQSVSIDNERLYSIPPLRTLQDGTQVTLKGSLVTLKNVQSPHTLHVQFLTPPLGFVRCYYYTVNGVTCHDGGYVYGYYNSCWQEISVTNAPSAQSVPQDLQQFIPTQPCCVGGSQPSSPCPCQATQQQN